ncbi:MAG TPA: hypothetical protein VHA78_02110 [Candidatus Peribacteraceae bacterium]|nr:hypothetical protein [Candidatus Peribacteraceae bacterium]
MSQSRPFHFCFDATDPKVITRLFRSVFPAGNEQTLREFLVALGSKEPSEQKIQAAASALGRSCGGDVMYDLEVQHHRFTSKAGGLKRCCLRRVPKAVRVSIATCTVGELMAHLAVLEEALRDEAAPISVNEEPTTIAAYRQQLSVAA